MPNYKIRKRLAEKGILFDGLRFTFDDDQKVIQRYLDSGLWKLPKRRKANS